MTDPEAPQAPQQPLSLSEQIAWCRGELEWKAHHGWPDDELAAMRAVLTSLERLETIIQNALVLLEAQRVAEGATGPINAFHAACPACGAAVDVIPDVPLVPAAEAARSLQAAIRERDDMGEDVERLRADVAEAHDCIGRLQALVRNAEYWVSHGCSEKATEAMRQAMADSWSQMGWRDICRRREQLRKER